MAASAGLSSIPLERASLESFCRKPNHKCDLPYLKSKLHNTIIMCYIQFYFHSFKYSDRWYNWSSEFLFTTILSLVKRLNLNKRNFDIYLHLIYTISLCNIFHTITIYSGWHLSSKCRLLSSISITTDRKNIKLVLVEFLSFNIYKTISWLFYLYKL